MSRRAGTQNTKHESPNTEHHLVFPNLPKSGIPSRPRSRPWPCRMGCGRRLWNEGEVIPMKSRAWKLATLAAVMGIGFLVLLQAQRGMNQSLVSKQSDPQGGGTQGAVSQPAASQGPTPEGSTPESQVTD